MILQTRKNWVFWWLPLLFLFVVKLLLFLANVHSRSRLLFAVACPSICLSVVCNVRAPYSDGSNFLQYFYGISYLGRPLTSTENFTEIVPGNPSAGGVKHEL